MRFTFEGVKMRLAVPLLAQVLVVCSLGCAAQATTQPLLTTDAAPRELDASSDGPEEQATPDDAGADPVPGECAEGANRCDSYRAQACTNGAWSSKFGDQSCCYDDSRFNVYTNTVFDGQKLRTWYRVWTKGRGSDAACNALLPGSRLPTNVEATGLLIGQSVCWPMIDQRAFKAVPADQIQTSDGCVNLGTGAVTVACDSNNFGFLCVKG